MQTQPITHGWGPARRTLTHRRGHPLVSPSPHTSHPLSWAAQEAHHPHPCPHPSPPRARSAAVHMLAVLLCSRSWPLVAAAGLHETAPHMGGRGKAACLRRPPLPRMRGQGGTASISMECPPPHIAPVRCGRCQNTRRCLPSRSHQRSHTSTQPTPGRRQAATSCPGPCPRAPHRHLACRHTGLAAHPGLCPRPHPGPQPAIHPLPANASCHALPLYNTTPTAAPAAPHTQPQGRATSPRPGPAGTMQGGPSAPAAGLPAKHQVLSWTC